ncbi:hypothetical protein AAF712_013956 [Marasmius tenuissimus]|uniref:Uncharacterized protein n=1 Tax=Marasmius tenuissimus TaxID=585030 RepID=A0ABR2ZDC6_9AGAR
MEEVDEPLEEEEPGQVKVQPKKKKHYQDWPPSSSVQNYHVVNLQAQAPPTDFLKELEQITDGSGLKPLPDRKVQFLLMLWEWRHIKMAKQCGRCHNPTGVKGTLFGEAAVQCCACPHPKRNLPEGRDKVPKEDRYVVQLIINHLLTLFPVSFMPSSSRKMPTLSRRVTHK